MLLNDKQQGPIVGRSGPMPLAAIQCSHSLRGVRTKHARLEPVGLQRKTPPSRREGGSPLDQPKNQ
jgi:hypothetical protein